METGLNPGAGGISLFANALFCFQGCHLALHCHLRRGYASGKYCGFVAPSLFYITWQVFLSLDLNCSIFFLNHEEFSLNSSLLHTPDPFDLVCPFPPMKD